MSIDLSLKDEMLNSLAGSTGETGAAMEIYAG